MAKLYLFLKIVLNKSRAILFWALLPCLLFGGAQSAFAGPFEETVRILENNTSFHWGRDCLVWIVYYPEELIDPWVDSEAGRTGMTESEREAYKKGFVSDLSIGKAEAFLFTVYAFGSRQLSFAPFAEKIELVTSSGERIKPLRYDRVLDQPLSGIVQGLVFFPKQKRTDFALAVRGMGVYDERIFAFSERSAPGRDAVAQIVPEDEIVVVELPASPKPKTASVRKPQKPPLSGAQPVEKIEQPRPQPPAPSREPNIVLIEPQEEESQSMADFVESIRSERNNVPAAGEKSGDVRGSESGKPEDDPENAYISREKTLRTFLTLWMDHNAEKMYSMLSASSQKLFSQETFEAELRKAADFRAALKDGYKIDWMGTERAKVVAVKRLLMIRALTSRTLGVVREDAAWKIVW